MPERTPKRVRPPKTVSKRYRTSLKKLTEEPLEVTGPARIDTEHRNGRQVLRVTPIEEKR